MRAAVGFWALLSGDARVAGAQAPLVSDAEVLGPPPASFAIESAEVRFAHFDQRGHGYQSRAGPIAGRGSERLWVEAPQLEVIARQGEHLRHRVEVPVDIVTAASPDAIDVVSSASRSNEAASVDWTMTYEPRPSESVFVRNGFHAEENLRSWNVGLGASRSLAEDNTTIEGSLHLVLDWFEPYELDGELAGGAARSTANLNLGLTQLLSPTTIGHLGYGGSIQDGELGNTWNTVPVVAGAPTPARIQESLPGRRSRHAILGGIAQWLPWSGAAHGSYRFYVDDWGAQAHTLELELHQRLSSFSRLVVRYRGHVQEGVSFFVTDARPGSARFTADSDLESFTAHAFGFKAVFELPDAWSRRVRFDLGAERYARSNDLRVVVYSVGMELRL